MCGITGIVRFNSPVDDTEIKSMTKSIAHRGPDGEGVFIKDNIALGHRRLSIIDLDGGKQPMSYNNGSLHITYNGEIYNYIELKKELKALGHKFKTKSDTEVILASYVEWEEKCLEKLRGMFAFCIADFKKKEIFLARDPIGIKPLVYWKNNDFFGFASELPALRKIKAPKPTGNISAIDDFLRLSYIPAPNTIYKDIYKLEPGTYMTVSFDGNYSEPTKYYNLEFDNKKVETSDWIEKTNECLQESVKSHLVSDVPFGVFLSGGIDSTLVAGAMSKILDTKIKAFTIGFNDPKYDELKFAEIAASKFGIELISETIDIDDTSIIEELINNHGEPFGDSSIIPTWHVCKLARSHVPMVLSGDGGDELFGGYLSHSNWIKNSPHNYIKNQFEKKNYYLGFRGIAGYTKKTIINKSNNFLDEWYSNVSCWHESQVLCNGIVL
jgi:asparagine synthase (glutamine-hydrolysing)